jgi:cytosine/adenosine deaminase-related metal-dependent hydrolase
MLCSASPITSCQASSTHTIASTGPDARHPCRPDTNLFTWRPHSIPGCACSPRHLHFWQTALAELALSGCTTAATTLSFPKRRKTDDEVPPRKRWDSASALRAARCPRRITRGLPPDAVVTEDAILQDSNVVNTICDPRPGAMVQIVLAPCSPFPSRRILKQSAQLARQYIACISIPISLRRDEERFCLRKVGHRPVGYMQEVEWVGDVVAHAVWVHDEDQSLG